jgi:hypothetical protein
MCLQHLEDAQERGDSVLSAQLAERVGEVVGPLVPGMSVVDVMELIFDEQERYLSGGEEDADTGDMEDESMQCRTSDGVRPRTPPSQADSDGPRVIEVWRGAAPAPSDASFALRDDEPMGEAEARHLTERIRTATRHVCLMLREVHDRRAWVALGYSNWEQYVQTEFSISRSRSYELLDQANVILALRAAAGITELPDVSAYVALQIKPRLPVIRDTLRRRIQDADGNEAMDILMEVVDEHRRQVAQSRRLVQERRALRHQGEGLGNRDQFSEVIERLVTMTASRRVQEFANVGEPPEIEVVESAIHWLEDLVSELKRKERPAVACHGGSRSGR